MQFVDRTVPANFNLFLFGDVHIGTLLHYEDGFDKFIDMLNSPYDGVKHNAAIGMGDYIEAIDHSDKRFDVHSVDLGKIRPDQQMDHFESKIKSSAKKIVLLKFGNHEGKLTKYYDYVNSACRKLSIPYGTYTAITTFSRRPKNGSKKEQYLFKSFTTHGNGSINSIADDPERLEANLNLSLKRKLKNKAGDCALMAMGHCFDEETEILTERGWMRYKNLKPEDRVMTLNRDSDRLEFNEIEQFHEYTDYKELIHCKSQCCDIMVTPKHGFWSATDAHNPFMEESAKDAFGKVRRFRTGGTYKADGIDLSDAQIRFISWLMAEGYTDHRDGSVAIRIMQSNAPDGRLAVLLDCLDDADIQYRMRLKYPKGSKGVNGTKKWTRNFDAYTISIQEARDVAVWVEKYLSDSKDIKQALRGMSASQCRSFLDAYTMADGHAYKPGRVQLATARKDHADFLHELVVKAGARATVCRRGNKDGYVLSITPRQQTTVGKKSWEKVAYNGNVWCVSVKNGTLLVRRNGKAVVTLNTHKLLVAGPKKKLYLTSGNGELKQHYTQSDQAAQYIHPDHRWYVNTGSFLRLYLDGVSGYAERAMYDPMEMGFAVARVRDCKIVGVDKVFV
jgi:hypothetical protein